MVLPRKQYGIKETVCTYKLGAQQILNGFKIFIFPTEEGKKYSRLEKVIYMT